MTWHLFGLKSRAYSLLFLKVQSRLLDIYKELKITVKCLILQGWIMISWFILNRAYTANALISTGLSMLYVIIQSQTEVVFLSWEEIWDKRGRETRFCIRMSPRPLEVFSRRKGEGAAAQSCRSIPHQNKAAADCPHQNRHPTIPSPLMLSKKVNSHKLCHC